MTCFARVNQHQVCPELSSAPDGYCRTHHQRDLYLRRVYGINLLGAEQILDEQDWKCPVTGDELTDGWVVDHSHRHKRVRGILSRYANHRIVGRHEDWVLLQHAAEYLRDPPAYRLFPEQQVPKKKRKSRKRSTPAK